MSIDPFNIGGTSILFTVVLSLLPAQLALGHGGGLDSNGGHNDRKYGGYHCHREPCISMHAKQRKATEDASTQQRQFTPIYQRSDWKHWTDADNDCMNTRHEMLKAQADGPIKLSPDGCYVSTGVWDDPFSGKRFTRASDLDVDHIVPLKWASDHGGHGWPASLKEQFANDPINLLVVDDGLNQQKGAEGPTEWLPPNQAFRCEYLAMWQQTLAKYTELTMTPKEVRVFIRQLTACQLEAR